MGRRCRIETLSSGLARSAAVATVALRSLIAGATEAHAAEEKGVAIEVRGPASCSGSERLLTEVRARTPRAHLVPPEEADLALVARIREG